MTVATPVPGQPRALPTPWRGALRVCGVLRQPAELRASVGAGALLMLHLQPAQGLPYEARVDLGTDLADQMQAEALLPALRTCAVVSVCGDALALRQDHGHAVLRVLGARDAVLFSDPTQPAPEGTTHAD